MTTSWNRGWSTLCCVAACASVLCAACSGSKTAPPPAAAAKPVESAARPGGAPFWGDMKPVVSVKELMEYMIDPASDYIFDSVKIITTKSGTVEKLPRTDEDWDKLRIGATTLAEGIYLLKVQRPFTPPGDVNNSVGPNASELSPTEIKAKLERDPVLWNAKIEALRNVGLEVLDIAKRKKADDLWEASYDLDQACESCHVQYWYPGDPALLKRIDEQLKDLFEKPSAAAAAKAPARGK